MQFSGFDIDGFLRDAWQKKPLLIRNPWAEWSNPLDPDELAGLACESEVESRLITQSAEAFELENGPLPEGRFGKLGRSPWTLLVQAVDHHVPEVAALLGPFRFIPNWRVDDVMVSYAVDGGGVGPHFDNYDVFLVQGLGRRRWQVGPRCDDSTALLQHDDLRLLADFEPVEDWILEPGDMLYVPPGFAHNGIAVGDDCMTYSIGFRAPSRAELLASWCEDAIAQLEDGDRYVDPDLARQENPGEITAHDLARLQAMVAEKLLDREAFGRWFGQYSTSPKNPEVDWRPDEPASVEDLRRNADGDVRLLRNPAARFSFIRSQDGAVSLFIDGQVIDCEGEAASFAERLCQFDMVPVSPEEIASAPIAELIVDLFNQGSIAFGGD